MTMIVNPPAPLAEYAHNAQTPARCPRCKPGRISVGQRIARLPTGEWVHAWCVAQVVPDRPRRTTASTRPTRPARRYTHG